MKILKNFIDVCSMLEAVDTFIINGDGNIPIAKADEPKTETTVKSKKPVVVKEKEVKIPSTDTASSEPPVEKPEKKEVKKEIKTSSEEAKALPPAGITNRLYANVFYSFVDKKSVPKMPKAVFNSIAERVYNLFTNQEFVTAYPYMYHTGYNFVAINLESKLPAFELCAVHTLPNGMKYMKVILFTEDENSNNIFPDSRVWFTTDKENKQLVQENVPYGGMTPCDIYYSLMGVKDNRDPALAVNETA